MRDSRAQRRPFLAPALTWFLLAGPWAVAEQRIFTIELPDGEAARFEVPLQVEHAGRLSLLAEWEGSRTLGFRIELPDGKGTVARRSGTPPIELNTTVRPEDLGHGTWMLVVHALPLSGASRGTLTVDLPEPAKPVPAPAAENGIYATAAPPKEPEPWQSPRRTSAEWTRPQTNLARATETLRKLLVENSQRPPDTCRWQDDLLRWLTEQRDGIVDEGAEPDAATGKLVTEMAETIRLVEEMRVSREPLIVGPIPADPGRRLGWSRLRDDRLRGLKASLDELIQAVHRNHAPELRNEEWPLRLVSCVAASERYFDQRWIVGEERAPNRDLVEAQWTLIRHAAAALEAVAELSEDDVIRLGTRN